MKLLLCLLLCVLPVAAMSPSPVQDADAARDLAGRYFDAQKSGSDVREFFCNRESTVEQFNVGSYSIQSVDCDAFECAVRTRVNQTNRKGEEIVVTWIVKVRTRPEGSCIHSVTKG